MTAATLAGYNTGSIATDPSGDVWVPNDSTSTILEIIGVGTPAVTPLSSQLCGTKP